MLNKFGFVILAVIVCALLWAVPAPSQQHQQGKEGATQPQIEVKDADMDKAAAAYVEVAQIQRELQESLQTAPDLDQRQALQENANQKMIQAVEGEGIDVEKYRQIMAAVSSDEDMRQKFMEKIQELPR
ncbi:DUF4168 domain-containing protein [Desulfatiglans anilini]|uniref:DUF4168 domain-containing protein n=1 Tax=Desulfatiglans anilini TaxID=90728 RepID=UPI0004897F45|nr:DUF4168 domain-containing protein [Desulfatiglans anilini]